jgi:hypothetical protein
MTSRMTADTEAKERRRMWATMTTTERINAINTLKAVRPKLKTQAIADQLGASYHAIVGVVYRIKKGYHPNDRHSIKNKNPLIREIFERAFVMGLSVKMLAYRAGYSEAAVAFLRQGRTTHPQFPMVVDLAQAVGLKLEWKEIEDEIQVHEL